LITIGSAFLKVVVNMAAGLFSRYVNPIIWVGRLGQRLKTPQKVSGSRFYAPSVPARRAKVAKLVDGHVRAFRCHIRNEDTSLVLLGKPSRDHVLDSPDWNRREVHVAGYSLGAWLDLPWGLRSLDETGERK
jgi:hypothetical protein